MRRRRLRSRRSPAPTSSRSSAPNYPSTPSTRRGRCWKPRSTKLACGRRRPAPRISARAMSGSPSTASWPKNKLCSTSSTPATTDPCSGSKTKIPPPCHPTRSEPSRTSAAHLGSCSPCPRRPGRAKPPRCAPSSRPRTAATGARLWCWRPPARPSTSPSARAPATWASPSPRLSSYSVTKDCSSTRPPWSWSMRPAWSAQTTCANFFPRQRRLAPRRSL
jgi:hypothetical protein